MSKFANITWRIKIEIALEETRQHRNSSDKEDISAIDIVI